MEILFDPDPMNTKKQQYRQGDVLIERVSSLPKKLTKIAREHGRLILAHGEVTGHAHAISARNADLYSAVDAGDVTFLEIREAMVALQHDEHATINLPPGSYIVRRQREYSPEEIRRVAD
jgi:hypothetical protein